MDEASDLRPSNNVRPLTESLDRAVTIIILIWTKKIEGEEQQRGL